MRRTKQPADTWVAHIRNTPCGAGLSHLSGDDLHKEHALFLQHRGPEGSPYRFRAPEVTLYRSFLKKENDSRREYRGKCIFYLKKIASHRSCPLLSKEQQKHINYFAASTR